jgi:hypothetical protein
LGEPGEVRRGQARSKKVRKSQVRSGKLSRGQAKPGEVRLDLLNYRSVSTVQTRFS